jgi:hypothetical protein
MIPLIPKTIMLNIERRGEGGTPAFDLPNITIQD